ncbi:hypothetical protein COY95_03360 [Candidatus Woesearchaeota archaeon CG_4_10_14_0_8_um_filter_47_5]|nr:MAG: hypothetical protein COY95_03360 [Candidatus Woesearchaeota archaeon CG_4_10_14_0_8_um_filter_47_5]
MYGMYCVGPGNIDFLINSCQEQDLVPLSFAETQQQRLSFNGGLNSLEAYHIVTGSTAVYLLHKGDVHLAITYGEVDPLYQIAGGATDLLVIRSYILTAMAEPDNPFARSINLSQLVRQAEIPYGSFLSQTFMQGVLAEGDEKIVQQYGPAAQEVLQFAYPGIKSKTLAEVLLQAEVPYTCVLFSHPSSIQRTFGHNTTGLIFAHPLLHPLVPGVVQHTTFHKPINALHQDNLYLIARTEPSLPHFPPPFYAN